MSTIYPDHDNYFSLAVVRATRQYINPNSLICAPRGIADQECWLGSVVRWYYAYHTVPTSIHQLEAFRTEVVRNLRHALMRLSQRHRTTWERMALLLEKWVLRSRIQHP